MKRFNLTLTQELFDELKTVAGEQGLSTTGLMRKLLKFGLYILKLAGNYDHVYLMTAGKEEDGKKHIVII